MSSAAAKRKSGAAPEDKETKKTKAEEASSPAQTAEQLLVQCDLCKKWRSLPSTIEVRAHTDTKAS